MNLPQQPALALNNDIANSSQPVLLRGFANNWPLVQQGKQSAAHAIDYLLQFYNGRPVNACFLPAQHQGRVFYNDDLSGFNFQANQLPLQAVLAEINQQASAKHPNTCYVASTEIDGWFPNFRSENLLEIDGVTPLTSIWLGNQSRIAAHFDFPQNIAICAVGQRKFTLFPPEQIGNLYVGPMDFAPGGQDISMVDFNNPDFDRFPKFKQALAQAQTFELEAGDALLIPSMWWHHVEALADFNVLITHWWRNSPPYLGRPNNALLAAILAIRSLPTAQRQAWKALFDHYVFDSELDPLSHLPEQAKGKLTLPLDELNARQIRADLLNKLKR